MSSDQGLLDRYSQIHFVGLRPVDDSEAPVTDYHLDRELAEDRDDRPRRDARGSCSASSDERDMLSVAPRGG